MKVPRTVGFILLSAFVYLLFATTLYNLFVNYLVFLFVFVFFTIGCTYTIVRIYFEEVKGQPTIDITDKSSLILFGMVAMGAYAAYGLNIMLDSAVLGTGIIGVAAAFLVKPYQVPIYCGAFVGMSSPELFGFWQFSLATVVASGIFVLAKDIFNGYGGKLGTIALSGALVSTVLLRGVFLDGSSYGMVEQLLIMMFSVFAAVVTYSVSIRFKTGPVFASGILGVLFGVLLPLIFPENGYTYAVVVIGASFVGMSGTNRFKDELPMFMAGVLFGLIFIFSAPYFGGAGGKLGTIAFMSVLSVKGIMVIFENMRPVKADC